MDTEIKIMSREVWSGAVRIAHACLMVSVLALMVSGWLIASAPSLAQTASELHHLLAAFFTVSLGFRLTLLLTDKNSGHWRRMLQAWPKPAMVGQMLLFYLTLGRSSLPKWYAHNFMWVPLYFLLFIVLLLQTAVGVMMIYDVMPMSFYPPDLHRFFASIVFWFVVFHTYAVVLHDIRSKNANVSAMINGYRYFEANIGQGVQQEKSVSVKISDIK